MVQRQVIVQVTIEYHREYASGLFHTNDFRHELVSIYDTMYNFKSIFFCGLEHIDILDM